MNWKKLLLIAATVGAFTFVAAPKSEAGVSVGIGVGFPVAYPAYGYPYYPYAYGYPYPYYPYGYGPYYGSFGFGAGFHSRSVVVVRHPHVVHHHHP